MIEKLMITLRRSLAGSSERQRATIAGLGLRRIDQTVEMPNNPNVRGMIAKVGHMLKVMTKEQWDEKAEKLEADRALRPPIVFKHE
eukprot:CAMPEP_0198212518 /NCGR_PEP_ID=MMETSP1445-20131203/26439_1 /TAXON_ID=36898 /ORGANISM="Pyramimonas sp., Strain CCMP2087" /LENGTH=85 /DNA_ID=CAMNT_0043886977 /DNA_START=118 /DNA_END=375 /DNA_ORIENTATION=-